MLTLKNINKYSKIEFKQSVRVRKTTDFVLEFAAYLIWVSKGGECRSYRKIFELWFFLWPLVFRQDSRERSLIKMYCEQTEMDRILCRIGSSTEVIKFL